MAKKTTPLEDEVGDVLDKAIQTRGLSLEILADLAGVPAGRIQDALDYRSELCCAELSKLAAALKLNEVGLCALGAGRYPLPDISELPFGLHVLSMAHGVGRANAYLVTSRECSEVGLLFDTGPSLAVLLESWPQSVARVGAVFLTHVEGEHTGGLCDVVDYFGIKTAMVPQGAHAPCGKAMREGETYAWCDLRVTAFNTPGHSAAHNCYYIEQGTAGASPGLLIAGDLIFAGSAGGAFFNGRLQQGHLRRILAMCPDATVLAPGHGPMTSVRNEKQYNPFCL